MNKILSNNFLTIGNPILMFLAKRLGWDFNEESSVQDRENMAKIISPMKQESAFLSLGKAVLVPELN